MRRRDMACDGPGLPYVEISTTKTQPARKRPCLTCVWMQEGSDPLCERLATDVDEAFSAVVETHADLVFGVALRVTRNEVVAEDVAQEAFVRAYRALKRYTPERVRELRLRPWLARVALNAARNEIRARRLHADLDDEAASIPASDEGPLRLVERNDERRMWARLLAGLPDRYRLAVALRYVDDLSYAELAETLGRPLGSVKSDVHRGTALLRAAYDAENRALGDAQEAV
jgi:RNA polymerase sigma-70 factor (ECF subfamily)